MGGFVTSYSGTTLTISASSTVGSGTYSSWAFNVAGLTGASGPTGATGATGVTGNNGATGATGLQGSTGISAYPTSSSELSLGTGSKTFIISPTTGHGLQVNDVIRLVVPAGGPNYLEGPITADNGAGSFTMNATEYGGSGTSSIWNVRILGFQGATGPTGPAGATGAEGIGYRLYSFTSNTIGTGSKTFTVTQDASNSQYQVGMYVSIGEAGGAYIFGPITSYTGTTLVVNSIASSGSGTYSTWGVFLNGAPGTNGADGSTGATGAQGNIGATGAQGSTGAFGATGAQGNIGATGAQGETGAQGNIGATGAQGSTGAFGSTGATGPAGATGAQGNQGASGATGIGYRLTSTSSVSLGTGTKTYTVSLDAANSMYIAGMTVSMGAYSSGTGVGFNYGTITSYSGTTLVINSVYSEGSGTYTEHSLVLLGAQGAQGVQGATGAAGTNGTNGSTGATGPNGATGAAGSLSAPETQYNWGNVAAGTYQPNVSSGTVHKMTLTGSVTISTLTNAVTGTNLSLILTQDATGSRLLTSTMKFAGGVKTLSTAANSIDVVTIYYDGTNYLAGLSRGYA
jgi:hypothetical protein